MAGPCRHCPADGACSSRGHREDPAWPPDSDAGPTPRRLTEDERPDPLLSGRGARRMSPRRESRRHRNYPGSGTRARAIPHANAPAIAPLGVEAVPVPRPGPPTVSHRQCSRHVRTRSSRSCRSTVASAQRRGRGATHRRGATRTETCSYPWLVGPARSGTQIVALPSIREHQRPEPGAVDCQPGSAL